MLQNSGSEQDLQALMDQRKRKRMISNRESARRSRMRKQKHLDDLASLVTQLRNDNHQILASLNLTTHKCLTLESHNSVLRAQVNELSHWLESLNQIIDFLNATNGAFGPPGPLLEPDGSCLFNNVPCLTQHMTVGLSGF